MDGKLLMIFQKRLSNIRNTNIAMSYLSGIYGHRICQRKKPRFLLLNTFVYGHRCTADEFLDLESALKCGIFAMQTKKPTFESRLFSCLSG